MKKFFKTIVFLASFIGFVLLVNYLAGDGAIKQEIEQEFRGIIVGDTAVRKGTRPLHLKIINNDEMFIEFAPDSVRNYTQNGDSIIKPANQNKLIIIRDGIKKEFVYRPRWEPDGRD